MLELKWLKIVNQIYVTIGNILFTIFSRKNRSAELAKYNFFCPMVKLNSIPFLSLVRDRQTRISSNSNIFLIIFNFAEIGSLTSLVRTCWQSAKLKLTELVLSAVTIITTSYTSILQIKIFGRNKNKDSNIIHDQVRI